MRNESMQLTASFVRVPDIKFIVKQRGFDVLSKIIQYS